MSDQEEIHRVSKALSDEFRVRIMSTLIEGPPQRYSELLRELYPEDTGDSGRLAYHLNILSASGLVTKVNDTYRVTEMGCQIYASMKQTVESWDELVLREELKSFSVWEVTMLLWSESFQNIGGIMVSLGIYFTAQTGEIVYGLIPLMGLLLAYLGRTSTPNTEDRKEVVSHLKRLLGKNRLMPGLINTLGIFGSTIIVALGLLNIAGIREFDNLLRIIVLEGILGVAVALWLSSRMYDVWGDFQQGRRPKDYGDILLVLTSVTLVFNIGISIVLLSQIISKGSYPLIWLPIQLMLASYSLMKDTTPE
ncbi:hypothetical protein GF319_15005 [Candidatus Bathyarchaeota archaeon]|nr:hypothetical protein [Candidatus Bathyarchaeota archaeon]